MNLAKIISIVGLIGTIGAMIGGAIAYDNTVAKTVAVQQSLSVMATGVQIQLDTNRLDTLMDRQYAVQRILLINPNDAMAQEEKAYLNERIAELRHRIEENSMNLTK